jgi:hypothetical protein
MPTFTSRPGRVADGESCSCGHTRNPGARLDAGAGPAGGALPHRLLPEHYPDGKPAGNFADVYRVELELDPPAPQPHPRTYAIKVLRGVNDDGGRTTRRRGWKHEIGVMERVRDSNCPNLAAVVDHSRTGSRGDSVSWRRSTRAGSRLSSGLRQRAPPLHPRSG